MAHKAGIAAARACRGTLRDKMSAFFAAEPVAKREFTAKMGVVFPELRPIQRPPFVGVAGIIRREEERYIKLLERAPKIVKKWFAKREITGESLAALHHTHGIDPTTVEDVLGRDLESRLHDDYVTAWKRHKQTGSGK